MTTRLQASRVLAIGCAVVLGVAAASGQPVDTTGTRLAGVRVGPYAVGFDVRQGLDATRPINQIDGGTRIGIATWYPAGAGRGPAHAMTTLEYRLLGFANPSQQQRRDFEDDEVKALLAWRHIGIVELTRDQARASLHTSGVAVRGAPAADGRFPVVVVLGGQHYLSTTAESLASHGFLVVAAFRYAGQSNEIGTNGFGWYLENSVRDAEWALSEIRAHPNADMRHVSAIGHGGGGMLAMLLAMRNRSVGALVNIDAGNFSSRSRIRDNPLYSARLMRVPYLYIATADTRTSQDQFEEFQSMAFSERFEVIFGNSEIRHHDLSDLGRAVTAPMAIRGASQADVQQRYADVQEMAVRFLLQRSGGGPSGGTGFAEWLQAHSGAIYTVTARTGIEPAPTLVRVLEKVDGSTVTTLRDARRRDPEAALFQPASLARIVANALATRDLQLALALADFAVDVRPGEPILQELKSLVLDARGEPADAVRVATACAAMKADNDWQASGAIARCKERAERR
jgi:dienelactone hydrolase